jgi:hypothetical protein
MPQPLRNESIFTSANLQHTIILTALLLVLLLSFIRAAQVFAPGTQPGYFSSDEAIPILMSNDGRPITLFNYYYYGEGRWGGWPFLFAQLFRRTTGFRWTDQSLFLVQTIWVFIGTVLVGGLASSDRVIVSLIYLLIITLHPGVANRVFVLSQVYGWQVTALLFAWYGLRRFLNSKSFVSQIAWAFITLWFSFLAIWSSFASVPMLFFLAALEATCAYRRMPETRAQHRMNRPVTALALVGLSTVGEYLMRADYHRYNFKRYRVEYGWAVHLDRGYLIQNVNREAQNLWMHPWWRVYYVMALLAGCLLLYSARSRSSRSSQPSPITMTNDVMVLIGGSLGIALINFVGIVLADHVRLSLYDNRFMTLIYLFASMSGLLSIFWILKVTSQRWLARSHLVPKVLAALALITLVIEFPPRTHNPDYDRVREIAATLEQRAPDGALLGSYWNTYIFVCQQADHALAPIPLEGQQLRTPWTPGMLRTGTLAVLEYGDGHFPVPQTLVQYGKTFNLIEGKWYENGRYAFALYVIR